tara:strand:- start:504 stop:1109 length:606 start_codon:yes stop_codon:yes gene_type:complete
MPTLSGSMWSLLILMTTANYPDVMMPAYADQRAAVFYFACAALRPKLARSGLDRALLLNPLAEQLQLIQRIGPSLCPPRAESALTVARPSLLLSSPVCGSGFEVGANWFLLNVVLAVVYKGHGDRIKQAEEEQQAVRARALKKAFALLDVSGAPLALEPDPHPQTSRSTCTQIRPKLLLTRVAPHIPCVLGQAAASYRSRS